MANEHTSGYDRAMELIEAEFRAMTGILDLGMLGLKEIPKDVFEMTWLTNLTLGESYLAPGNYQWVVKEIEINHTPNELSALPQGLGKLKQLEGLFCGGVGLKSIDVLGKLPQLVGLGLGKNEIKDFSPCWELKDLRYLDLRSAKGEVLAQFMNSEHLKELYLTSARGIDLEHLEGFLELEKLFCSHQKVAPLPLLPYLPQLRYLSMDDSQLGSLEGLEKFPVLESLSVEENSIDDLRPLLRTKELQSANLRENRVEEIPYPVLRSGIEIHLGREWVEKGLQLFGNPIENPPLEICTQGRQAMLDWYETINPELSEQKAEEMEEFGPEIGTKRGEIRSRNLGNKSWESNPSEVRNPNRGPLKEDVLDEVEKEPARPPQPLNEAKILLIGDGASGKTSLVKQFFGEPFDPAEPKTDGILIRQQGIALEDGEINARFWDFGGQEIMHATHRFFLSRRSLYMVVLDARKDDDRVEYWLNHVRTYGGDSPVMVVVNKVDENPGFQLNNRYLAEKYGTNIKGFFRISCQTGEGIVELQQAIELELFNLEFRKMLLADSWRAVKEYLEIHDTDFISYERYRQICRDHEVIKMSHQNTLLGLLNALGIVLHFEELNHFNTQVLNPLWLTNAVYRLINSKTIAESNGLFKHGDMDAILNTPNETNLVYPPEKFRFLALVMQEFELAYKVEGSGEETHLIPELLPVLEPKVDFPLEGAVQLRLEYRKMLPPSLLPRFIVRMHPWVEERKEWRTGVVLQNESMKARARIRLDKLERCIRIEVVGEGARRMMSFVRDTFLDLHREFKELDWEELVPVRKTPETVKYSQLTEMERVGAVEIYVKGLGMVPVAELLNGIESPLRRTKHEPMINVFVSYSHAYPEHKQKLLTFLAPYIRANEIKDVWDDSKLIPGKPWDDAIWKAHGEANLIICLLSPEFLGSDYCYEKEFKLALENEEQEVVCIVVEDCPWQKLKPLAGLQTIAANKSIASYENVNQGWNAAMKELDKLIEEMK